MQGGGEAAALQSQGAQLWSRTRALSAQRGAIFDRNGDELALSVPAATVAVNPKQLENIPATIGVLAQLIGLDDETRDVLITQAQPRDRGFLYVARQIDPAIAVQIDALELVGVTTYSEDRRMMPGGATGRSVIGLTDIDGNGTAGMELQFDSILRGTPGQLTLEVAPGGRSIAGSEEVTVPAVPGRDIVTTLDRSVQYAAEEALLDRVGETGGRGGFIIVMDTDTGDIVAMASVRRNSGGAPVITSGNYAAVDAYEPGSVGKVITVAGALEDEVVTPETTWVIPDNWDCTQDVGGVLSDSHPHPPMPMSVRDILVQSSNVGTIRIGQQLTYPRQDYYMRAFGLGEVSALDFPGESPGILKPWNDWTGTERCTMAYGQGVASSPVQMAAAVNTIANNGTYVAPRVVSAYVGADGDVTAAPPSASRYVVSPQVASTMWGIMNEVVCSSHGTARDAQVDGVSVAGKTGTAYKAQADGTYYNEEGKRDYYTSFVGFFPAEAPQVTVLVAIDEPAQGTSGGQSSAPVFQELVPTILHEMGIEPPVGSRGCEG